MFPNIVSHDRKLAVGERVVLIGRGGHLELARFGAHQPGPAATELVGARGFKFFLESVKAAKSLVDRVSNRAGWVSTFAGTHDLPEHAVVHVATAVVADRASDIVRQSAQVAV